MLGVSQSAISQRVARSPRLQKVQDDIVEKMIDAAENTLHDKMHNEKNLTASIFYLKTKGKHRGYVEKHQNEVSGKLDISQDDWVKKMEQIESNGTKKKTKAKK